MNKLLKNNTFLLFLTAAVLNGCGKESPKEDFAVRINKSYLNSSELDSISINSKQYRSELIRNWVNRELLYQMAVKEGITESKEFYQILENSKKELASSMMITRFLNEKNFPVDEDALNKYYLQNNGTFRLDDDSYLVNIIKFTDEDMAVKFRSSLLESSWNKVAEVYSKNSSRSFEESNVFKKTGELYPEGLMRILEELYPTEVSIVFKEENNSYYVLQLIKKYPKGTIPPFEYIKPEVGKRYLVEQRETALREYLEELYSNNDIEIRTGKK